jgi:Right handed beta helix region
MKALIATLLAITLLPTGLALATPVWTDARQAQALIETVSTDAEAAQATVDRLAKVLQLDPATKITPKVTIPAFPEGPAGLLVSQDLQLAMTQLSIHIGANNQIRVLRAQGEQRDALILQSGFSTLHDIAVAAQAQGIDGIRLVDGVFQLTRPLVVWLGAGLQLEPGDVLQMDAASGAFLLGFGQIEMLGAKVHSVPKLSVPEAYRPFVLITGQGTIFAKGTAFSGLGMVGAEPFNGFVISERGLFAPQFPPTLIDNRFEDVGVVGMVGVTGGVIAGNLIKAGRGGGISLAAVKDASITGNAVIGTKGGAGVKVTNGTRVQLTGNLVSGGARNGISVGGNSNGIEIGISAQRATCVLVAGNSIASNGASGLRLNESGTSRVQGNALVLNTNSGLFVGAQTKGGRVEVSDNLLAGNRVGLTGAAIGEVVLDQNNLTSQMPRLFDGEFSQYLAGYLTGVQQKSETNFRIAAPNGHQSDPYLTACNKG